MSRYGIVMIMEQSEQKQLVDLLKKLEPGFYPFEIFSEFARLNTMACIEFVPFIYDDGELKVVLVNREQGDQIWPGQPHLVGGVIRPNENAQDVFERLFAKELVTKERPQPRYVLTEQRRSKRGNELIQLFYVLLKNRPEQGNLYPPSDIPKNVIEDHAELIEKAHKVFKKNEL